MFKLGGETLVSIAIVVAIIVGILAVIVLGQRAYLVFSGDQRLVDPSAFQAVFLDNNQVYFGHLKSPASSHPVLKNVYYIQLGQVPNSNKPALNAVPSGRLIRLGENETHGPKDEMVLNSEHVLFWENLKPDSPIVRAIQNLR